MLVYWISATVFFLYLMATPVRAGIAWKSGGKLRIGFTVGPFRFSAHGDVKYTVGTGLAASLTHDRSGNVRELSLMNRMADAASLKTQLHTTSRALKYLFRHVRPWRLRALIHLSLPDAAMTAFLYGFLNSGLKAFRAIRPGLPLQTSVTTDFRSMKTQFDLCGILSCRLGHIMAAALIWLRDYLFRRIQ